MKKIIAGSILIFLIFAGFMGYQASEKGKQTEIYEEAAVFFNEADYKKAIQYFEEAREHDNLFTGDLKDEISYYQAEAYMNLGQTEEAIDIYNHFIGKNPREEMNYALKGYCLTSSKMYEEAAICYQSAYEATGKGEFLVRLCNLYLSMEDYESATEVIGKADQVKEDDAVKELKFLEIVIYEKQLEYGKAYEAAEDYCENYPEDEKGKKERDFLESRK